jgi:lycopene cyclase domain-containing protein
MSYATFVAIFLGLPLALLCVFLRRRLRDGRLWKLMGILVIVALAYMAPWDHLAAVWGLWTWAPLQTWQKKLWAIPLEEYLFCLLETVLAVALMYALLTSRRARLAEQQERRPRA